MIRIEIPFSVQLYFRRGNIGKHIIQPGSVICRKVGPKLRNLICVLFTLGNHLKIFVPAVNGGNLPTQRRQKHY